MSGGTSGMKNLTPKDVSESYEIRRKNTIGLVKVWVKHVVQRYEEPTRAGTKKGEPIGLSKKKLHAAVLMILYSPLGLSLKEIAVISKVSPGLIRLWRTESKFKETIKTFSDFFTGMLLNTIDILVQQYYKNTGDEERQKILEKDLFKGPCLPPYTIDGKLVNFRQCDDPMSMIGFLCDSIPFLNKAISPVVAEWVKRRIDADSVFHIMIAMRIHRVTAKNAKMLRRWHIESLQYLKNVVQVNLMLLAECFTEIPEEKREEISTDLRDIIFQTFDALAF